MKKLFLLTAIAGIFAFTNASAQKDAAMNGPKLGIGAEFALPIGDFADGWKLGFGGSLLYQHPVAPNLNLTANAGYISFKSKEIPFIGGTVNMGYVPVKVGARYFLAENFYINGELGAAFGTKKGSSTMFAYSPGVGVEFPVADKSSIDLGARYEGWSNDGSLSFIGIRAAFNFGL
ncbi:outer membrane beta-barrel protein [Pedobacter caeni]|uniref:Outer membrane protein beta-barrel domain-containing protein n=1 Tax=Pedobacter caeni TaxID=288992 RepID=A0A1M4ZQA5_9SPHI|nr:outer membrane beta-barrel protein [Pedobacter caeni]SHF20253.1 Outer membrane protein beta-barrel domain-containing protein [Pedobacter caeni]